MRTTTTDTHATTPLPAPTRSTAALGTALALWLATASLAVELGLLRTSPRLVAPLILGLIIGTIVVSRVSTRVRAAIDGIDDRLLDGWHTIRAPIGAVFLLEHAHGRLPALFAHRAGYGDLVAGGLAALLVLGGHRLGRRRRAMRIAFHLFGLADILLAFGTAQYLLLVVEDPVMRAALGVGWYGLLPTFVVPLVVLTHLAALTRRPRDEPATRR